MVDLSGLPGAEIVAEGIVHLAAGRETVPALLVAIASARLRRLGLDVATRGWVDAELRLYRALGKEESSTAYSRYNSLIRRLDSFASALEHEEGKAMRSG